MSGLKVVFNSRQQHTLCMRLNGEGYAIGPSKCIAQCLRNNNLPFSALSRGKYGATLAAH
jgi:hypothetical protein